MFGKVRSSISYFYELNNFRSSMLSRKSDILQFHYPLLTVVHPSLVLLVDEGSDIIT